jgi:GT2 family glycosyltransferase
MTSDPWPLLPVYVIHYDAPFWCADTVASLRASTGVTADVIVVDNGGEPPRLPSEVRVIGLPENRGYTGGANAALKDWRRGMSDWCLLASHDLRVGDDALGLLLKAGESNPAAGIVGPEYRDEFASAGRVLSMGDGVRERTWISGTCLLLRRACVLDVGTFDEDFGSYWEDVDYCLRARQCGWKVVDVTGAVAEGRGSATPRPILLNTNRVVFGMKHGGAIGASRALVVLAKQSVRALLAAAFKHGGRRELRRARETAVAIPLGLTRLVQLRFIGLSKRRARRGVLG